MALGLGVPVAGTAVDGLAATWARPRRPGGTRRPHALAGAISHVLAGQRPDPSPGRAYARQFTPRGDAAAGQ
jgi:hypothetical protein